MTENLVKVSQSKVKLYRQCRRAYHYKYRDKLRRKRIKRPFYFGTIIHSMIEAYANGDEPFELLDKIDLENGKMFRREREMYGELIADIRCIMEEYFAYWPEDSIIYSRRNKRNAEHEFEIELKPGLLFGGKIDAVGRAKKMRWLIEHKSFSRIMSEDERWRSVQSAVYIRAVDILGWWQLDGTLWDSIHSKPPGIPQMTKGGKLSEAKLKTLPSRVEAFLASQKLKAKDYPKLMENAVAAREDYFQRHFMPIKPLVIEDTWKDFVSTAEEIYQVHGDGSKKEKSVGRHCSWCDFEPLCRGEVQGLDVDFIRSREYTTEKEHALTEEDREAE